MAADDTRVELLDGEQLIDKRHPSWSEWSLQLALAGFVLLFGLGSGDLTGIVGGLAVGGGIIGYVHLARQSSEYVVTDQRVIKRVGLLRKATGEARIEDIRSLSTNAGILERLIGKGTVEIDSAGAGGQLGIAGVDDFEGLANTIREQQNELSG